MLSEVVQLHKSYSLFFLIAITTSKHKIINGESETNSKDIKASTISQKSDMAPP